MTKRRTRSNATPSIRSSSRLGAPYLTRYAQYKSIINVENNPMINLSKFYPLPRTRLLKYGVIFYVLSLSTGCTMTENGIVFGTPDYEKDDIKVSKTDLQILLRANQILINESKWEKGESRDCSDIEKYTLYCALETATVEALGEYRHRQPALQEVRFIIREQYADRWSHHRLVDFNANEKTSFTDIKYVINTAIESVNAKIAHNDSK